MAWKGLIRHNTNQPTHQNSFGSPIKGGRIYSDNIGIEFGIEKCAMLIIKSEKLQMTEKIELPNQGKIRTHREKEIYKYLRMLEAVTKHVEMKERKK